MKGESWAQARGSKWEYVKSVAENRMQAGLKENVQVGGLNERGRVKDGKLDGLEVQIIEYNAKI